MQILKFGGSSVGSPERIKKVISVIKKAAAQDQTHVVVSAFQGVTDQLIATAKLASNGDPSYQDEFHALEKRHIDAVKQLIPVKHQSGVFTTLREMLNNLEDLLQGISLIRELSVRSQACVSSFGEQLSAYIISKALSVDGLPAGYFDTRNVIITEGDYQRGRVNWDETNKRLSEKLGTKKEVQIITGFVATTLAGEISLLGRGGSDYTASIIGSALNASKIQIWTDVDGVMTANPKQVSRAFTIPNMTYEEALEMSHFGAKVIYAPTMLPAMKKSIPLSIHNTFNPDHPGTIIGKNGSSGFSGVRGFSSVDEIALIKIQGSGLVGVSGTANRLFNALAKYDINIILITQASSEYSICLAVAPEDADLAKSAISEEFESELSRELVSEISVEADLSVIAVVGDHMQHTPGIAAKAFQALASNGINIVAIAQGSSERNISAVVEKKNVSKALNALHSNFFLSGIKTVNLYMVGTGLIGKAVLEMLEKQADYLAEKYLMEVRLCGIANTKQMLLNQNGIFISTWDEDLQTKGKKSDLKQFITEMRETNLPNSIFLDCTASQTVADTYPDILKASISLVTPNKKANSTNQSYWKELQQLALRHNVKFLYETNVGAGLPIVETIRHQVSTGDRIHRIEGILSGTLSYLFNSYDGKEPFSDLLRKAKELGYTEPDPRDDLNGHDVARKLLILARESGFELEFEDIDLQNLVPIQARDADSVDEFFETLAKHDDEFLKLFSDSEKDGKVLRYIARYENGKATVRLDSVDSSHPFYNVQESDNVIVLNSDHYKTRPMVISGPGAGAYVTAAGVMSDILKIGKYAQ